MSEIMCILGHELCNKHHKMMLDAPLYSSDIAYLLTGFNIFFPN